MRVQKEYQVISIFVSFCTDFPHYFAILWLSSFFLEEKKKQKQKSICERLKVPLADLFVFFGCRQTRETLMMMTQISLPKITRGGGGGGQKENRQSPAMMYCTYMYALYFYFCIVCFCYYINSI